MPKEPTGSRSEDPGGVAPDYNFLETRFYYLEEVLGQAEDKQWVDLNEPSDIHPSEFKYTKEDDLIYALDELKKYIDKLSPDMRHYADGLVIRAELYLAAHVAKK
jgi:hypothetical protein